GAYGLAAKARICSVSVSNENGAPGAVFSAKASGVKAVDERAAATPSSAFTIWRRDSTTALSFTTLTSDVQTLISPSNAGENLPFTQTSHAICAHPHCEFSWPNSYSSPQRPPGNLAWMFWLRRPLR